MIKALYAVCQNGFYEKDGIVSWHDFLFFCHTSMPLQEKFHWWNFEYDHSINSLFWRKDNSTSISLRYQSKKGLEIVSQDLNYFCEYFARFPTQFDFPFVLKILDSNVWEKYGIYN